MSYTPLPSVTPNSANVANVTNVPNVINTVNLSLNNTIFTSTKVASIPVLKNSFLYLYINAESGPNSNISIIIPGLNSITLAGNYNGTLRLGSDFSGKIPFNTSQTVTIIFNVSQNEKINIKEISYNVNIPINYKTFLIIFLIVFFIFSNFLKQRK